MSIVTVYRIEHPDTGLGPYADHPAIDWAGFQCEMGANGYAHDLSYRHPCEGGSGFGEETRWAFDSMHQLREWFGYFGQYGYDRLTAAGFHVVEFTVSAFDIHYHERQVTFDRSRALAVATHPIPTKEYL